MTSIKVLSKVPNIIITPWLAVVFLLLLFKSFVLESLPRHLVGKISGKDKDIRM